MQAMLIEVHSKDLILFSDYVFLCQTSFMVSLQNHLISKRPFCFLRKKRSLMNVKKNDSVFSVSLSLFSSNDGHNV